MDPATQQEASEKLRDYVGKDSTETDQWVVRNSMGQRTKVNMGVQRPAASRSWGGRRLGLVIVIFIINYLLLSITMQIGK